MNRYHELSKISSSDPLLATKENGITILNAAQLQHLNKNQVTAKAAQRLKVKKRESEAVLKIASRMYVHLFPYSSDHLMEMGSEKNCIEKKTASWEAII